MHPRRTICFLTFHNYHFYWLLYSQVSYHKHGIHNESFLSLFDIQQYGRPLTIRLKQNKKPTETIFDYEWHLPDNYSCTWNNKTKYGNQTIDIFFHWPNLVTCHQNPWSIFLSDSEKLDGDFWMGESI